MMMILAGLALALPQVVDGQQRRGNKIELVPIVGYQWGGGAAIRSQQTTGDIRFPSSIAYGLAADFEVRRGAFVEAVVLAQPTTLEFREVGDVEFREVSDLTNWYFHIGGLYEAINSGQTKPFAVITLGATQMNPSATNLNSEWFFSFALGGGVKHYVSERVALRAQVRAWVNVISGGTGFWFGTGGGGVNTWISETLTQGEVSAGLVFVL
jgi:opacity protein-like surface antigen